MDEAGQWRERDLDVLWHPCTQMREHPDVLPLVPIERGEGAWLVGRDGRRYLDAVSSWWTNLFGHAEPRIARAIAEQAMTLEQVILAGFSHQPAVELAEKLLAIAPRESGRAALSKVFYADNGSAGVEVALKMAFHWFRNRGEDRRSKFVALENGYHGETLGALAVTDIPLYRRVYAPLARSNADLRALARQLCGRARWRGPPIACALTALPTALRDPCWKRHRRRPSVRSSWSRCVQCAGGMRMHHPRPTCAARARSATRMAWT
jgi:adenosylmethionine-8-amino-7-oxononanoate aminotransferase